MLMLMVRAHVLRSKDRTRYCFQKLPDHKIDLILIIVSLVILAIKQV